MLSILWVTRKPPPILTAETRVARAAMLCGTVDGSIPPPMSIKPPTAVIPEIAFVTDMRGECKAGVTPQTVW